MDHGIWQDTGAWRECIETTLKLKMNESTQRMKRRASRASLALPQKQEKEEKDIKSKFKSTGAVFKRGFGKLDGKIKGLMQSKEQKFNEEAAKHQTLIFDQLSKYVQHFCNMAVPFD